MSEGLLSLDREAMRRSKYLQSYADLSRSQLLGLLWLVGEWSIRAGRHGATKVDPDCNPRAQAALDALGKFTEEPLELDEVLLLIGEVRKEHQSAKRDPVP